MTLRRVFIKSTATNQSPNSPFRQNLKSNKRINLWREEFGQSVHQVTVRNKSTKDNPGTSRGGWGYFKHDAIQQIFGSAMGSPISPVIADLVMEEIEVTAIATAPHPPTWWFRYVDDSHTCLKKHQVDEFHQHLNSINPSIQFTLELEDTKGQELPFLDTITTRKGTQLEVNVYRKPTHTDRYLDFNSHHPMCHKRSVVSTLYAGHKKYHQHKRGNATK